MTPIDRLSSLSSTPTTTYQRLKPIANQQFFQPMNVSTVPSLQSRMKPISTCPSQKKSFSAGTTTTGIHELPKNQFLMRSEVLTKSNNKRGLHQAGAACSLTQLPKCASFQYGKQHRRPAAPGRTSSTTVRDRVGALKDGHLVPGQQVSVDHFIKQQHQRKAIFVSRQDCQQ